MNQSSSIWTNLRIFYARHDLNRARWILKRRRFGLNWTLTASQLRYIHVCGKMRINWLRNICYWPIKKWPHLSMRCVKRIRGIRWCIACMRRRTQRNCAYFQRLQRNLAIRWRRNRSRWVIHLMPWWKRLKEKARNMCCRVWRCGRCPKRDIARMRWDTLA